MCECVVQHVAKSVLPPLVTSKLSDSFSFFIRTLLIPVRSESSWKSCAHFSVVLSITLATVGPFSS